MTAAWLTAEAGFREAYPSLSEGATRGVLARRLRRLKDIDLFVRCVDHIKGRRWRNALTALANAPLSAPDCIGRLLQIGASHILLRGIRAITGPRQG